MTDPIHITGLTLIDKVLEFERMTSDKVEWSFEKQKDNIPRLIRLRQLNVLLNIFTPETFRNNDIVSSLNSLIEGHFISIRDINSYENLFKQMDGILKSSNRMLEKSDEWALHELEHNFTNILQFKRAVNKVLKHNTGVMEISYPYFYSYILTSETFDKIDTKKIDDFLSLVIDPLGRTYTKKSLIDDYDYPTEDVYDVDLDYW